MSKKKKKYNKPRQDCTQTDHHDSKVVEGDVLCSLTVGHNQNPHSEYPTRRSDLYHYGLYTSHSLKVFDFRLEASELI